MSPNHTCADYVRNPKATDFVVMGDGWRVRRLGWQDGRFWYQAEWDCHPGVSSRTTDWQEAERWAKVHIERTHIDSSTSDDYCFECRFEIFKALRRLPKKEVKSTNG